MLVTSGVEIEKLIDANVPPLPSVAMRVATLSEDVNVSTNALASAIGLDPVLSAYILRAANSPLCPTVRSVTALPAAVNVLGANAVHTLAMVHVASGAFASKRVEPFLRALWEHSVAVGLAAREISSMLGMRGGEESFLCGLLHDIGKLALYRNSPETYPQIQEAASERQLLDVEKELYGYTHAQVGALLARRWQLPEEIAYVIHCHHQPSHAEQYVLMARVVDVANALANAAGVSVRHPGAGDPPEGETILTESVIALRLTDEQLRESWTKVRANLEQTLSVFE